MNYLKSLIDKLNKNRQNGLIFKRPLTDKVEFAKVYSEKPNPNKTTSHQNDPKDFYLIKNSNGDYVGVVYDIKTDLQWFVDFKFRRQGHLIKALKEVILFHLFQNRISQKITISKYEIGEKNFKSSERIALALGFIKKCNNEYILSSKKYTTKKEINGHNIKLSNNRITELKNHINYLGSSLLIIQSEIEINIGITSYTNELKELADEIIRHSFEIEDIYWNKNADL